jgi:hypothetical protein
MKKNIASEEQKEEIKKLILELYPAKDTLSSCKLCSKQIGYTVRTLQGIFSESTYNTKTSLLVLLSLIKEKNKQERELKLKIHRVNWLENKLKEEREEINSERKIIYKKLKEKTENIKDNVIETIKSLNNLKIAL